mmetsp:Transcript_26000/g.38117  ORF Transcript_26000/g.38117 Transcript_26000/m.38117 type:complete len:255 (+) Transcript_26000:51-815(+)
MMYYILKKKKKKKKNSKKKPITTDDESNKEEVKEEEEEDDNDESHDNEGVENPWPGLVDLLFNYPENNMYQIQFYRLLHSVCAANHEPTLKVLVQKTKFVGRAIDACELPSSDRPSNYGVLLRCLNALRLRSQSLPPQSFLYHYLDSHDKWKAFEDTLRRITIEQQIPGGGVAVPNINGEVINPVSSDGRQSPDINIDLGSVFATELGFSASIYKTYVPGEDSENKEAATQPIEDETQQGDAKKKKNKKKKKKK